MSCNIGKTDKIVRIVLGIVLIALGIMTGSWLGIIGIIPLGTGIMGFCPIYTLIGLNTTCKAIEEPKA